MIEITIRRADGRVVCSRCLLADSPGTRLRGLLGRRRLDDGEGMFLATSAIHTSFMLFPIDAVFVDEDFGVVDVRADLKPWRFAISRGAHGVIELPAGYCARIGLEPGEQLSLTPPDENGDRPGRSDDREVRVLVATRDARFARVATFLLARQGFEVETRRRIDGLATVASKRGADVIVVDGTGGIAAAARATRSVAALNPGTEVVVVADEELDGKGDSAAVTTLDVLPKWAGFDAIVDAVRAAHRRAHLHELD
jgi:uncharacterized protein